VRGRQDHAGGSLNGRTALTRRAASTPGRAVARVRHAVRGRELRSAIRAVRAGGLGGARHTDAVFTVLAVDTVRPVRPVDSVLAVASEGRRTVADGKARAAIRTVRPGRLDRVRHAGAVLAVLPVDAVRPVDSVLAVVPVPAVARERRESIAHGEPRTAVGTVRPCRLARIRHAEAV